MCPASLRRHKPPRSKLDPVYFLPAIVCFLCFTYHPFPFLLHCCLQEMLAIMKSIYDMMGRYTYPCVRDEAPYEHVDKFFQVTNAQKGNKKKQASVLFWVLFLFLCLLSSRKWIKTGMVSWPSKSSLRPARRFVFLQPGEQRDLQILCSCHMFYHML